MPPDHHLTPSRLREPRSPVPRGAGFTLIELMVVLFIIGLSVGFIVLSVSGRGNLQLAEDEARRLVALIELAQQEAIIHNREIAVNFSRDGYRFLMLADQEWQPIAADELLRPRELPPSLELKLTLEGDPPGLGKAEEENTPHLFLLSSGESTPFEVTIEPLDERGGYRLIGREEAKVVIEKLDDAF